VLAISRFRYDEAQTADAAAELSRCLDGLGACQGFLAGSVGRALDDPGLWVLQTQWDSVGSYRRALSSYQIKMTVVPVLARAVDEPSAFEVVVGPGATKPNEARARGAVT
jgi:quinol monooxygenase YgiN